MSKSRPLTTGRAAQYCNVSQATIINWIKQGKLEAYATPGGHHRILLPHFLSFLETYGMPVDSTLRTSSRPRVLVVSGSPSAARLVQILQEDGRFDVAWADNDYEASAQVVHFGPDAVVLDTTSVTLDCLALCRWLRASPERQQVAVLAVGIAQDEEATRAAGADAYLPATAVAGRLGAELQALLALERS